MPLINGLSIRGVRGTLSRLKDRSVFIVSSLCPLDFTVLGSIYDSCNLSFLACFRIILKSA